MGTSRVGSSVGGSRVRVLKEPMSIGGLFRGKARSCSLILGYYVTVSRYDRSGSVLGGEYRIIGQEEYC